MKTIQEQTVVHNTFVIERSYRTTPERVFSAFSDPAKKRRWYAEGERHEIELFEMDFRAGGTERSRYRFKEGTPFPGVALANSGTYVDIVPERRVVMASAMTLGEKLILASLITFEFVPTDQGTDLIFTHQGAYFDWPGGPEMIAEGWRALLERLSAEFAG